MRKAFMTEEMGDGSEGSPGLSFLWSGADYCPGGCSSQRQRHLLCYRHQEMFLPRSRSYFRVASAARKELSMVDKGQAGHSERWMDSVGDVKESLRMGSSNMIKILPWLRLTGPRMTFLFLARNAVPWNERERNRNLLSVPANSLQR